MSQRMSGLRGLGYSILGYTACAYALAHYVFWVLPKKAWLRYAGKMPPPHDAGRWSETSREGKC